MILGITGGFGCGKSSVLRFFESRNYTVFDADMVCHSFYNDRHPVLMKAVKNNFGEEVFTDDGNVDRKKMAQILFASSEKMNLITAEIYPLLTEKLENTIRNCRENNIHGAFELPLLYEAGFEKYFDAVMAIWTPAAFRCQRLSGRGFTAQDMARRDKMQIDPDEKLERADFGIINSGTLADLQMQLERAAQTWEN